MINETDGVQEEIDRIIYWITEHKNQDNYESQYEMVEQLQDLAEQCSDEVKKKYLIESGNILEGVYNNLKRNRKRNDDYCHKIIRSLQYLYRDIAEIYDEEKHYDKADLFYEKELRWKYKERFGVQNECVDKAVYLFDRVYNRNIKEAEKVLLELGMYLDGIVVYMENGCKNRENPYSLNWFYDYSGTYHGIGKLYFCLSEKLREKGYIDYAKKYEMKSRQMIYNAKEIKIFFNQYRLFCSANLSIMDSLRFRSIELTE